MRLIDADALRKKMYHEAFETDSDMQKWEGGCWIRYKMFENAIVSEPTVDAVPVLRCKDCKHSCKDDLFGDRWCQLLGSIRVVKDNFYCSYGERKDNGNN